MDIVDQNDVAPAQSIAPIRRHGKDSGDGARPRPGAHPAQRRGRLGATQDQGIVRHAADPAERCRDQRGLVEATRP